MTGIPHHGTTAASTSAKGAYAPYVQDLKAQNVADSSPASPAVPIAVAAGLLAAGATGTAFALHRRRRAGQMSA